MPHAHAHTQVIAEMLQQLTLQQQDLMVHQRAHREGLDALSQQMLTLVQQQTVSMEALVKVSGGLPLAWADPVPARIGACPVPLDAAAASLAHTSAALSR